MISEMNQERFEEAWALPTLTKMVEAVEGIDASRRPLDFMNALFVSASYSFTNGTLSVQVVGDHEIIKERLALYKCYNIFDKLRPALHRRDTLDDSDSMSGEAIFRQIRERKIMSDDARFTAVRDGDLSTPIDLALGDLDNEWVRESGIGRFMALEEKELKRLQAAVAERVKQRKEGLASILSL